MRGAGAADRDLRLPHLPSLPPAGPSAPPARARPRPPRWRPRAPGHHLPGHRYGRYCGLGSSVRCRCGRRAPGRQRSAPRTERPGTGQAGRRRGRDPPRRARAAAESSPRSAPAAAGDAARSAPAAALSAEGGREGGRGGREQGEEEEGGGSGRGGRRAARGPQGSRAMRPVRTLLSPRTCGVPVLPGPAVPREGASRGRVGAAGNWGPWHLGVQRKSYEHATGPPHCRSLSRPLPSGSLSLTLKWGMELAC